jgi:N-acetyl sugar amidotransferase
MQEKNNYQICGKCVMDTTDSRIEFDEVGICNHCKTFETEISKRWFPNKEGKFRLKQIIDKIKQDGKRSEYDCIIGLSGGIDSSYLALKVKDFGLRPLVVHVDAGWNSELAVYNIEQIVKYCNYDLHTHVMDWEEMKDLQLAYFKAGIANQDVPQDHAFSASMYHFAIINNIKYVLNGGNIATESILPTSWLHSAMDSVNLRAIHKYFGTIPLKQFKVINSFQYYFLYPFIYKFKTIRPLNYMEYNKGEALEYLKREVGYKEYSGKHCESIFTKFYQNYYFPVKYGRDKRRAHLSSLILSGQISRDEALLELEKPLYDPRELEEDMEYIAKKLSVSLSEFKKIIDGEKHDYSEFRNWDKGYIFYKKSQTLVSRILKKRVANYS